MNRRLVLAFCAVLVVGTSWAQKAPPVLKLALQPLGAPSTDAVAQVKADLERTFAVAVTVLPAGPLPKSAWYPPRSRWRANEILDHLEKTTSAEYDKVLALTERDISIPKEPYPDWGIFGLALLGGRPAAVSTFRLRRKNASEALFRDRLAKVALHETGHLFGLDHCPKVGCLLEDARGTITVLDEGSAVPCEECEKRLRNKGVLR